MNKQKIVQDAFFSVASNRSDLHGKWIPADYWSYLVNRKLAEEDNPSITMTGAKLRTRLEDRLGIALDSFDINHNNGVISFIESTKTKVSTASSTKSKEKIFFCLITGTVDEDELPSDKSLVQQLFQTQFTKYEKLIRRRHSTRLTINTSSSVGIAAPVSITPTEEERYDNSEQKTAVDEQCLPTQASLCC